MKFTFVICSIMEALIILIVTLAITKNQIINAENQTHITYKPIPFSFENDSSKERNEKYRISSSTNNDILLQKTSKKYENPSTYQKNISASTYTYPFKAASNPFENQTLNQLDGRLFFKKSSLLPRMSIISQEFGYQPDKRGPYFEPLYPMVYHPNHFNDHSKSFYYPHLHKRYGLRNSEDKFINRNNSWGKLITDDDDNNPWRIIFYPPERTYKPERIPLNSVSNVDNRIPPVIPIIYLHYSGAALKPYDRESKNRIDDSSNAADQRIDGARLDNFDSQTTTDSDLELLKTKSAFLAKFIQSFENASKDDAQKGHLPGQDISANFEKEDLTVTPENGIKENRFERPYLNSDLNDETYNLLPRNRVYYEMIPFHSNPPWYVYARCSRENCQSTNSTNATELIDQGWILYNCTPCSCINMYPEPVLHIGVFLLLVLLVCLITVLVLLGLLFCEKNRLLRSRQM